MPTVLAQSNLPKSAAVVVSSETIILRDPNNSILEKYTSDEQKQLSLKSYGIKPATLLSPGENKTNPEGYNLIFHKWLQNDGSAYIDTGIIPLTSYKFEFSAIHVDGNPAFIYGILNLIDPATSTYSRFEGRIVPSDNNRSITRLFWKTQGNGYLSIVDPGNNFLNIIIDKGNVIVDGESKGTIPDFNEDVVFNNSFFLFSVRSGSTPTFQGSVKIAYFKIYDEEDNLLRDFVPATKGEEIGMYDKVSKTLFINKNNVGSFIAGDEIASLGFGSINPNSNNIDVIPSDFPEQIE